MCSSNVRPQVIFRFGWVPNIVCNHASVALFQRRGGEGGPRPERRRGRPPASASRQFAFAVAQFSSSASCRFNVSRQCLILRSIVPRSTVQSPRLVGKINVYDLCSAKDSDPEVWPGDGGAGLARMKSVRAKIPENGREKCHRDSVVVLLRAGSGSGAAV